MLSFMMTRKLSNSTITCNGWARNQITFAIILDVCWSPATLDQAKAIHSDIINIGLHSDVHVGTALIRMSAKCGELGCAQEVFDRMVKRNLISWTTMIGAYAGIGQGEKPFDLFLQMQREGLGLNAITYLSILNPDASAGALGWLNKVHCQALKAGLESDVRVGSALVQTYAKSGSIEDARHVFDRMSNRDVMSWTVMIGGLAQHGYGQEALQLFEQMKQEGVQRNGITFCGGFECMQPCRPCR